MKKLGENLKLIEEGISQQNTKDHLWKKGTKKLLSELNSKGNGDDSEDNSEKLYKVPGHFQVC